MNNCHRIPRSPAKALILAAALSVGAPVVAWAENLADALVGAYNTSNLLEQNRALLRAADEDVAISMAALRPVLDFVTNISRSLNETEIRGIPATDRQVTASTMSLSASMLIWDNGRSNLNTQAAKELVLATRAALLSIEQQVLLRGVAAYMNVLRANEFVDLGQNNVRVLSQELRAAQDRFDVGEVTRTDVALAESRLAEARSNLAVAQGDQVNAQQEYLTVVGRLPGNLSPPPGLPALPANIDAGKAIAVRNHPDVIQAQHQVAASELTVMAQEAGLGPTVSVTGSLSITESRNDISNSDSSSIGLNYNQRIYQGGALAAGIRRAMAQRDASRASLLSARDVVAQGVATGLVRLRVAQATLVATDERIRAAQVAFDGVREEATLGARTTLDVLDAEQELLDARARRIAAQTELQIAAYQILAAQGALTAQNLNLAVQVYDPAAYYNQVKNAPAYLSQQGQQLDRVLKSLGKQ
ncbi:MAG: TolC family outer membrane protein [Aestuariivita sp.]|uniref:TolC family outer membrane protein n=1 Tax=Aestuariivita sp. TaxID=1872407 RepID=UPI003BB01BC5